MDDLDFPGWEPTKSVQVVEGNGLTQVLVKGQPYMRWQSGDEGCTRLAIVQLYECGLGTEEDLAAAFGRHINSVQNYLRDFTGEGIQGLMTERRGPKGQWKLTPELRGKILHIVLREGIWKLEAIQQRLLEAWQEAVSVPSIQQVLEENGLGEPTPWGVGGAGVQAELFAREPEPQLVLPLEGCAAQFREPVSTGSEPLHIPERQRTVNSNAGGEEVGAAELGRGWQRDSYSPAQRVYLDQWEQGAYNAYAGGLLFAPLLARYQFIPTLSRIITTATHEGYSLAVDERFAPWLFLIRSSSEDLLQKIPELIEKAKRIGEQAGVSRQRLGQLIVVFDREGYSAELYRYLDGQDQGAGQRRALFVSWAKYSDKWVNDLAEEQFNRVAQVTYEIRKAEAIPYLETTRTMNKYGKIRAVVIESGRDKKRAAIYTNGTAEELGAERIVQLICRRWGEENAIKELLHKHLINYTPGYVREELEEQPLVENPELRERKKQRAGLVSELNRLKIELADHLLEPPAKKRGTPSRSQKEVMDDIAVIEGKILLADDQLEKLPSEIRFDEAHAGEKLLKLNHEKKRFLDCIKVFVCNSRAEMCRLLLKHYDRPKEVIPALAMIVERTGYVKLEGGRLEVTLRRFTDREIDYAARHLCEDLNRMQPVTLDKFHLPIRYHVQ